MWYIFKIKVTLAKKYLEFAIIISFLIYASVFFAAIFPPIVSFDTYFHLAVGREVAITHQIPKTDSFTFVGAGREWISNEWLAGLVLYFIYDNFHENGILALRTALGILTLGFIVLTLNLAKINFPLKILTLLTIALVLSTRMIDRPEMISFVFFAFLIYFITKYQLKPKPLLILPIVPIFAIWPNIQGYAPIGLAVFAFYVLKVVLAEKLDLGSQLSSVKGQKFLVIIFLLSSAAAFLQFKRFLYFLFLNQELFGYVSEVRSVFTNLEKIKYSFMTNIPIEIHILFIFTIVAFLSFFLKKHQKLSLATVADFLFVAALCILAFRYSRTIPLFVLLASPIIAQNLNQYCKDKEKYLIIPISLIILIMIFSIYQNKLWGERHNTLYIFDKNNNVKVATSYTWKERRPTAALDFIKTHLAPQKLMTSLNWSNQTLWQLDNKTKVMLDIIYEKQTAESYADYLSIAGGQDNFIKLVSKYDPEVIMIPQPYNLVETFKLEAWKLEDWNLVYVDDTAIVYAKKNLRPDLALTAIHPELSSELKFKPEEKNKAKVELQKLLAINSNNVFAAQQLIMISIVEKNYDEAKKSAQESMSLFPKDPNFYILLATANIQSGNCAQTPNLRKAKSLAKGYFYIKDKADSLAASCNLAI